MELLQLREKEVFDALKKIRNQRFAIIGGYAVNAYALPRFSVDCDIVTENKTETEKITKELGEMIVKYCGGEYNVEILVEGDDENGAEHSIRWEVKVQVEKDNHDIQIRDVAISPSSIDCSRTIGINVDLKNQGENDEDEVVVKIESATLGINQEDTSIPEIEEGTGDDTEYSKTYPFTIGDKVKAGTYQITLIVTDDAGNFAQQTITVNIANPPQPQSSGGGGGGW